MRENFAVFMLGVGIGSLCITLFLWWLDRRSRTFLVQGVDEDNGVVIQYHVRASSLKDAVAKTRKELPRVRIDSVSSRS